MEGIKAVPTKYHGRFFRSRLEARYGVFFDALGVPYEYEPETYKLPNGMKYLPDFKLKCYGTRGFGSARNFDTPFDLFVEVKGEMDERSETKITTFCGLNDFQNLCENLLCSDCVHSDCEGDYGLCPRGYKSQNDVFNFPVLVVGKIPTPSDSSCLMYESAYNRDHWLFYNYVSIDGDDYLAIPTASEDGKFYLTAPDYFEHDELVRTYMAFSEATYARFEWGEVEPVKKVEVHPDLSNYIKSNL